MYIVLSIRCGNEKDQVGGFAIQRIKVYTIFYNHCCQSRLADRIAFSMRYCNSLADAGSAFFLSGINLFSIPFAIIDLAAFDHQINDLIQRLFLVRRRTV